MAVTWLARHGRALAKHRLAQLAVTELEEDHGTTPGLLLLGGDVAASILAHCELDGGGAVSESELARRIGASRPAVRAALAQLRARGYSDVQKTGCGNRIALSGLR